MKSTLFAAASLVLGLSLLPLAAQQPPQGGEAGKAGAVVNYNAGLVMEYTLTEGGKVIARSVVHGDLQDSSEGTKSSSGTVPMRLPGGGTWTIYHQLETGQPEEGQPQDDYLNVEVSDLQKLQAPSGDSNTITPFTIVDVHRRYKGPGTYVLFEDGDRKLSLTVTEKTAVEKGK